MLTSTTPGRTEFIALVASIMMIVAFAIDSMLPALPAITDAFDVTIANRQQFVITVFMVGFGAAQLLVGTLSDRFGRRGLMLFSLVGYAIFCLAAAVAPTFELLLVCRAAQGMAAAGARVLVTSVVRDRFVGREMAQVMSLASVVFMAAPILAPAMGQLILEFAPWRWIFIALALLGATLWFWALTRLPETLKSEDRIAITFAQVRSSWGVVLADRQSSGYTIAMTGLTCATFGFLTSVQQIFDEIFERPELLAGGFALMASTMAVASLVNSRIVLRFGMRLIGHSALIGFTMFAAIHAAVAVSGNESLVGFIVLQSLMMSCFALTVGNFGAMAMENVGRVAGAASSLQGSFSTILGGLGGAFLGQMFDGSTAPLYVGITVFGIIALVAVFITEHGQLFVSRTAAVPGE